MTWQFLLPGKLSFQPRRSPTSSNHMSTPCFMAGRAIPLCFHNASSAGPEALQRLDLWVLKVCGSDRVNCAASRASSFRPSFDAYMYAQKAFSTVKTGATRLQYVRNRARTEGMPYFLAAADVLIVSNICG